MEYICKIIKYPIYDTRTFQMYFHGMDIGILDIETTGLSSKNSAFILGGLISPEVDSLKVEQFFVETLSEETKTLEAFWKACADKDVLITFNGQHFDLPFMKDRSNGMIKSFPYHLDIYQLIKRFSPIKKFLPNLKQKTVEDYMGLWQYRKDDISGKDSIDLYYRFLSERSQDLKDKILLHNHDDIVQLYRLFKVFEKTEFHKAMFSLGFPIKSAVGPDLKVEKIDISNSQLKISGMQHRAPAEYRAYELNGSLCNIHFDKNAEKFHIDLPLVNQSGLLLLDMEALDFYYKDFNKYPACKEGFLILQQHDEINYLEINHFIKVFIERMINQWITYR